MRKTLQYGESWELATLKVATLLVGNVGTRSQLVGRLSKHNICLKIIILDQLEPKL